MKIYIYLLLVLLSLISNVDAGLISGSDIRDMTKKTLNTEGKPYVAVFMSESCPCTQSHFDHLNELQAKSPDIQFIGFHSNKNSTIESIKTYFADYKVNFPIILDTDLKFANKFKALKTPHIFLYNKKNELVFQGAATNSRTPIRATKFYLKDAISAVQKGIKPKIKNAKTVGCYIQR